MTTANKLALRVAMGTLSAFGWVANECMRCSTSIC